MYYTKQALYQEKHQLNPKGTDYFVGDIHGCFDLLLDTLNEKEFDYEKDRLFSVGDLIDRGPDSEKCLRVLLPKPWFFAVLGNHEDMLLGGHDDETWRYNGGDWAFQEGVDREALGELLLLHCPVTRVVDTVYGSVGVVHAESDPSWLGNGFHLLEKNLWERRKILSKNTDEIQFIDRVVVGHTPTQSPVKLGNVLYIDQGAAYRRNLTVLSAEELFTM